MHLFASCALSKFTFLLAAVSSRCIYTCTKLRKFSSRLPGAITACIISSYHSRLHRVCCHCLLLYSCTNVLVTFMFFFFSFLFAMACLTDSWVVCFKWRIRIECCSLAKTMLQSICLILAFNISIAHVQGEYWGARVSNMQIISK